MIDIAEASPAEDLRSSAGLTRVQLLRVAYHPVTRKIGRSLLVAVGVMLLSFAVMRLAPGDPALALVGENASQADIDAMREKLGLTGPIYQQLWEYVGPLFRGDLGSSIISGQSVNDLLADSMPVTLSLITCAMILALGFSLLLAVPTAKHRFGVPGLMFRVLTSVSLSLPVFFTGQILILLVAIQLGWLPVGGYVASFPENLRYLLLPAITACGPLVPVLLRVLQISVVDTMGQGFVETAQVRGLTGPLLTWRYLLRPSLAPTIALSSYIVGTLFGSAVVLELVFNLPGAGTRLLNAVFARDYPVVQGIVLVIGILVVLINLLADVAIGWLDPRAKGSE